ncbi:helix-turn-helix transcriptional regulator [Ectobacillus ponti]|uniref:Helix-turn-helix domain-containing protein n=1 Tax=Ectobacillus ponti TaxID=2961894 RepID=A0AA41X6A6_9BACI|nr:helix-turn-helix domain-containing protein [Ectobacillus ponti]MCP8967103.1 helix-turn-helix domain-containing protein [Ectobacillus ponti]
MEQALKVTNVLSDPTRYYIYQYIAQKHAEVTVQEIADEFQIHPNVARLHLTKLEDVSMLVSETKKTGKGGRPSRLYRLSNDVIQLQFPFRDYKLLSQIALDTLLGLGKAGQTALYETGKKFGKELMNRHLQQHNVAEADLSFEDKVAIAREALITAGLSPEFDVVREQSKVFYQVYNCPFKELAQERPHAVCDMHGAIMRGIFETLFETVSLVRSDSMLRDCKSCNYQLGIH